MIDLVNLAANLCTAMDKEADKALPSEIAGVVKTHSKLAVGSAWIPIPGADVAAGATTIWTMYGRINGKIGLAVKDNVLKTIASGVATNLASYAAVSGVGSMLKFIPGIGTVGGALIMSATLYAVTMASGAVYLKALCALAQKQGPNIDLSQLGSEMKKILSDKTTLKAMIKDFKKDY